MKTIHATILPGSNMIYFPICIGDTKLFAKYNYYTISTFGHRTTNIQIIYTSNLVACPLRKGWKMYPLDKWACFGFCFVNTTGSKQQTD